MRRMRRKKWQRRLVGVPSILLMLLTFPAAAGEEKPPAVESIGTLGATVEELLDLGRQLNPDVAAAALEAEAAVARIGAAGALPDPMFRTELEDIERGDDSLLPERVETGKFWLEQDFPLWGKRGLERDIARAEAGGARHRQTATTLELAARIKSAFAGYYAAHEARRLTDDILRAVGSLAEIAGSRYAQTLGTQQEAYTAQLEKARLEAERARVEGERRRAAAQLNALLNRPAGAPLTDPQRLRPMPPEPALNLADLVERAHRANPIVAAEEAGIAAAEGARRLVEKSWYPDLTVGIAAVDSDRRFMGYEAMAQINIPLQWGVREARLRETTAQREAARARRDAAHAQVRGELEKAYRGLTAALEISRVLEGTQVPAADLAFQAALRGYEQNQISFTDMLLSEQRLFEARLGLLQVLVEQQVRLADIERLIGSDL